MRTFTYDNHGRLLTRTTPEQGATTYGYNADRSYDYDHVGRPTHFTSGSNARHHTGQGGAPLNDGPYSQSYAFDVWGNRTYIERWGGIGRTETVSYTNKRRALQIKITTLNAPFNKSR